MLFTAVCFLTLFVAITGCKTEENLTLEGVSSYDSEENAAEEKNSSPLQVLIDVEYGSNIYLRLQDELTNYGKEYVHGKWEGVSLQDKIADMGGPSSVEVEIAPIRENERDVYLTGLRTEMMSGGGPDVFVCRTGTGYHMKTKGDEPDYSSGYVKSQPLFKFPQQAMKRNMFLALDSYIENAQFMEWDKLTPVVMEAGKTEKGQLLLPMTYTVATTAFRESDVEHTPSKDMKWEDMLSGGPHMPLAAIAVIDHIGNGLAPFADYEHDKLAVSEEEMVRYYSEKLDNREKYKEESGVPYIGFNLQVLDEIDLSIYDEGFEKDDPIVNADANAHRPHSGILFG